uniref:Uncharacterized protein n=1 Tax=Pundamilia nyererei TaxID=303518 RepID=A0A3B4EPY9_9CICH
MMIAPMIYCILFNIPLHIHDKYFKDLVSLIQQFLWGNSPHRLSSKKLQACAKRGGFSLPNFKWYYWMMNVKQLRAWIPTAPVKLIWSQIEMEVNGSISPWRELFDTSHKLTHPIIANAKILWCKLQRAGIGILLNLLHSLSKWQGTPLSCPVASPVEVLLSRLSLGKGITSKIYHLLQDRLADPLLKVKGYWAQDLALDISLVEWDSCLNNVNTMYKEIGSRFIQIKIIHRWHRTPQQLYKWNLGPTDDYWRCDGQNASILHILWGCSELRDWWENIMEVIFSVWKRRLGISPKLSILGITEPRRGHGRKKN